MSHRPLDEKLARISETRSRSRPAAVPEGKGRPPLRAAPDDFETVFVEIGRIDCETFYRAARITIDRWLEERGKARLIAQRADYVAFQRQISRTPKPLALIVKPAKDRRKVSFCVARLAAHYLRGTKGGRWIVSPTGQGDWYLGTSRKTNSELLDCAISKGFDVSVAELTCNFSEDIELGK